MALPKESSLFGRVVQFVYLTFWAHTVLFHVEQVHKRYILRKSYHGFTPTHIPVYLLAELIALLPWLSIYLAMLWVSGSPQRRVLWAAGGYVAGLVLSFFLPVPNIDLDAIDTGLKDIRTWLWIFLKTALPETRPMLADYLMHAGFVLAVCLTRTKFAKALDPALPQHDEDPTPKEGDESTAKPSTSGWRSHPGGVFLMSYGMLWVAAAELTKVGEDWISFFSEPKHERGQVKTWMFGSVRFCGGLMYCFFAVNYFIGSKTLAWNLFCAALSFVSSGLALKLVDNGASWQIHAQDLGIMFFMLHLGNFLGFFSRHTKAAHQFYKSIGVEHPAVTFKKANADVKEVPVAFRDEKGATDEKEKSTV